MSILYHLKIAQIDFLSSILVQNTTFSPTNVVIFQNKVCRWRVGQRNTLCFLRTDKPFFRKQGKFRFVAAPLSIVLSGYENEDGLREIFVKKLQFSVETVGERLIKGYILWSGNHRIELVYIVDIID